jgi:hypothetical protein
MTVRAAAIVGDAGLRVCGPRRRAALEHVRVDAEPVSYRRRGYGRVLVTAALARVPSPRYRWATTPLVDTVAVRAFWAAVAFPGQLGDGGYSSDVLHADNAMPRTCPTR